MTKVKDIFEYLCRKAPLALQMDFDNSGFQVGHPDRPVQRAILSLDVTDAVADEAIREGASLIVSHHPLIFTPIRAVTDETAGGGRILKLIEHGIAVISMHTNLDIAEGGVNDALMSVLCAKTEEALDEEGCGRIGTLDVKMSMPDFLQRCRETLRCEGLRYADAGRPVYRIAVLGGAGAGSLERAADLGCDTFVTADVKYHQFQTALERKINLIDAGHFCTENPVIPKLAEELSAAFPEVVFSVSAVHGPIIHYA